MHVKHVEDGSATIVAMVLALHGHKAAAHAEIHVGSSAVPFVSPSQAPRSCPFWRIGQAKFSSEERRITAGPVWRPALEHVSCPVFLALVDGHRPRASAPHARLQVPAAPFQSGNQTFARVELPAGSARFIGRLLASDSVWTL